MHVIGAAQFEDLATTLDTEEASELTPLFGQLFAVKDLKAMYVERQNSLMSKAASRPTHKIVAEMPVLLGGGAHGGRLLGGGAEEDRLFGE